MPRFTRYVGVRYSGRKLPADAIGGLRVFSAIEDHEPYREYDAGGADGLWSRRNLAEWLRDKANEAAGSGQALVVGMDHAFSFPRSYMDRHGLASWDEFLRDFGEHWPTRESRVRDLLPGNTRQGDPDEHRLTGRWGGYHRGGVFRFELPDGLAKASHAGLPWLDYLRRGSEELHVWPFDGFEVPEKRSVLAEVRPVDLVRRYPKGGLGKEDQEAYAICAWLQDRDRQDLLEPYFTPPLSASEKAQAQLEGWILGVM